MGIGQYRNLESQPPGADRIGCEYAGLASGRHSGYSAGRGPGIFPISDSRRTDVDESRKQGYGPTGAVAHGHCALA